MIDTIYVRCYYGRDCYYVLKAWTQEKVVVLSVLVLVLGPLGAPLGSQMGDSLRLDTDKVGCGDRDLPCVILVCVRPLSIILAKSAFSTLFLIHFNNEKS